MNTILENLMQIEPKKIGAVAGAVIGSTFGVLGAGVGAYIGYSLLQPAPPPRTPPRTSRGPSPSTQTRTQETRPQMTCPHCQRAVPQGKVLCMYCGHRLPRDR